MASVVEMKTVGESVLAPEVCTDGAQQAEKSRLWGRCWIHGKAVGAAMSYPPVLTIWCATVALVYLATSGVIVIIQNPDVQNKNAILASSTIIYVTSIFGCGLGIFATAMKCRQIAEHLRMIPQASPS